MWKRYVESSGRIADGGEWGPPHKTRFGRAFSRQDLGRIFGRGAPFWSKPKSCQDFREDLVTIRSVHLEKNLESTSPPNKRLRSRFRGHRKNLLLLFVWVNFILRFASVLPAESIVDGPLLLAFAVHAQAAPSASACRLHPCTQLAAFYTSTTCSKAICQGVPAKDPPPKARLTYQCGNHAAADFAMFLTAHQHACCVHRHVRAVSSVMRKCTSEMVAVHSTLHLKSIVEKTQ